MDKALSIKDYPAEAPQTKGAVKTLSLKGAPSVRMTLSEYRVLIFSVAAAVLATAYYYYSGYILAYGDAESHLNIAKRVIASPTPGFAQLGGVWLPLPHILLIPFVYFDFLWRTGLAGSIVSGISFVISSLFIYKTIYLLTKKEIPSILGALVFVLNPNALYIQSTALTEMPLIAFSSITIYFFIKYLRNDRDIVALLATAFFGFCTTLTRYDGWFLVIFMAAALGIKYFPIRLVKKHTSKALLNFSKKKWELLQGRLVVFASLAFFGVFIWLVWDFLILGDPFYFTHSEFSAKSQQNALLAANQLPAYHDMMMALKYYLSTSVANVGIYTFALALIGFFASLLLKGKYKYLIALVFSSVFVFNVYTLYAGQSVIFIPNVNPDAFKENVFNVRYGLMMLAFCAVFIGYLFSVSKTYLKIPILLLLSLQAFIFTRPDFEIITLADGQRGISSSIADTEKIKASHWLRDEYGGGYVLLDDYARPVSITESGVSMKNIIYIGNKPYWEESLREPEKYAEWIVLKTDDTVWKKIYNDPQIRARLESKFTLVYESADRKIFKRNVDSVSII